MKRRLQNRKAGVKWEVRSRCWDAEPRASAHVGRQKQKLAGQGREAALRRMDLEDCGRSLAVISASQLEEKGLIHSCGVGVLRSEKRGVTAERTSVEWEGNRLSQCPWLLGQGMSHRKRDVTRRSLQEEGDSQTAKVEEGHMVGSPEVCGDQRGNWRRMKSKVD